MQDLNPSEIAGLLAGDGPPPLLLDCREPWEFAICRIPGSELLPMGRIPAALPQLDRGRTTIVICHHGIRSRQVARFLELQGFTRVINLAGGVAAWAQDQDPAMPTY